MAPILVKAQTMTGSTAQPASDDQLEYGHDLQLGMRRGLLVFLCLSVALGIALLTTIWLATRIAPANLPDSEQAEIYAQVVAQLITKDDTFGGKLEPQTLYIYQRQVGLSVALERSLRDSLQSANRSISFVSSRNDLKYENKSGEIVGGGVLISLDDIVRTDSDTVATNGMISIANEAAGETRYEFSKINGHWILKASNQLWIS